MNYADTIPGFNESDRLGLTAFGSVLLHVVLVLGVGFTAPQILPKNTTLPTLDITLVNTQSETRPEQVDFLAQANQEGGGDTDTAQIAKSPLPFNPVPSRSRTFPEAKIISRVTVPSTEPQPELMTQPQSSQQIAKTNPQPEPVKKQHQENKLGIVTEPNLELERQRLSAEISQAWQDYLKRPKRKFLSARTQEFKYAAYMQAWVLKVERIGNLHYPAEAKRKRLRGSVVLDAQVDPRGKLLATHVKRSSGNKILDDAAVRSVQLAAPFDPFPKNIRSDVDILHITRTWQYSGSRLVGR